MASCVKCLRSKPVWRKFNTTDIQLFHKCVRSRPVSSKLASTDTQLLRRRLRPRPVSKKLTTTNGHLYLALSSVSSCAWVSPVGPVSMKGSSTDSHCAKCLRSQPVWWKFNTSDSQLLHECLRSRPVLTKYTTTDSQLLHECLRSGPVSTKFTTADGQLHLCVSDAL